MIGLTQEIDLDGLREIGEQVHALYSRGPFGRVFKMEVSGGPETCFHHRQVFKPSSDVLLKASGQGNNMEQLLATVAKACKSQKRSLAKRWFAFSDSVLVLYNSPMRHVGSAA